MYTTCIMYIITVELIRTCASGVNLEYHSSNSTLPTSLLIIIGVYCIRLLGVEAGSNEASFARKINYNTCFARFFEIIKLAMIVALFPQFNYAQRFVPILCSHITVV